MEFFNSIHKITKTLIFLSIIFITASTVYADEVQTSNLKTDLNSPIKTTNINKTPAQNNTKDAVYIKNIDIEGTNIIKPEYILNRLQFQQGDEYSRDLIQNDLKNIYKMGFFTDKNESHPHPKP